tara:strand:- start:340 stop:888 length:549 start_codon:yes stop_codon:yes gene_type:complete
VGNNIVDIQIKCLNPTSGDFAPGPSTTDGGVGDLRFTYSIRNIESVSIDLTTPVSPMALPQALLGDAENVLVKAEGNTMRFTVSWILHDQTTSVVTSQGHTLSTDKYGLGGSVGTADEQARFLTEEMQPKGVEYRYELIIADTAISRAGLIEKITLQKSGSTPITWKATLQFVAGEVATIQN